MNTDGKPHHIKKENDPFVGAGPIGMMLPFEDGPEDQGGEEGAGSIYFPFYGTVPVGIAESIGQGANNAGAHDGEELLFIWFYVGDLLYELTGKMGDRPEKEENGQAAGDGAHEVDAPCGGERIIAEQDDEKPAHEDEEGGAGGVGDLQLVAAGDELTAIPEAAGGFHGHDIDGTGNHSYDPAYNVVHSIKTHKNWVIAGKYILFHQQFFHLPSIFGIY